MKNTNVLAMVLATCAFPCFALAQSPLDRAAERLGIGHVDSLEFDAHGKYFQFTQAPAPELPWPPFDVDNYVATLDFARATVHARYHRVQVQEPGRDRPHAEATMDQFAKDGMAWNLTPAPSAIPANLAERNAELWASPQGFVKAALANSAAVVTRSDGSIFVSFVLDRRTAYEGTLSAEGEVRTVRALLDSPVLGDTRMEFVYSNYRDFGGVRFPAHIERRVADMPWYELDVTAVRINAAPALAIPAEVSANPAPSTATIDVTELAPGVLNFGGGTHNSVIVVQKKGIVVIEAPLGEERSLAVMAKVAELFPGRKIYRVINTHAHFDHAGGLRTYVAAGVTVVTQVRNAAYYRRVWKNPHTINPDRLAKSPRQARFETFDTHFAIQDDACPIEIYTIEGSGHNDAFAMVYLPKQKILVEADAWTPAAAGAPAAASVNPLWVNLAENFRRLNLDIERIAPLHGGVQDIAVFRAAARTGR